MDIPTKENPNLFCTLCNCKTAHKNPDQTLNVDNYKELTYEVSNNSIMTIGLCKDCYEKTKEDDTNFETIMESVRDGWTKEMDSLNTTEEDRKKYKDQFFNLKIVKRHNVPAAC